MPFSSFRRHFFRRYYCVSSRHAAFHAAWSHATRAQHIPYTVTTCATRIYFARYERVTRVMRFDVTPRHAEMIAAAVAIFLLYDISPFSLHAAITFRLPPPPPLLMPPLHFRCYYITPLYVYAIIYAPPPTRMASSFIISSGDVSSLFSSPLLITLMRAVYFCHWMMP